jgi:hypothetical protein
MSQVVTKLVVALPNSVTVDVPLNGADPNTVVNAIFRNGGVWSGTDPTTSIWYVYTQIISITPTP